MTTHLDKLMTEGRLTETLDIDRVDTDQMLRLINAQDRLVALAVEREIPQIACAVDRITERLRAGGRLFYVGAGTSGRLGILDASEMPPTFGTDPELVKGVIAGGWEAVAATREGAEDSAADGRAEMAAQVTARDAVVGIAASGRTPFTVAAVGEARRIGAVTVAVTNTPESPLAAAADVKIAVLVGPEVIMGSTRLKAGTAQKLVLNMISTGVMIKLGKVYSNLMVDMRASNEKLRRRAVRMVQQATGAEEAAAVRALEACDYHAKTAIVMILGGIGAGAARALLEQAGGLAFQAIESARRAGR